MAHKIQIFQQGFQHHIALEAGKGRPVLSPGRTPSRVLPQPELPLWPGSERVTSLKYLLRPPCPKEGSACAWTDVPSRSLHRAKLRLPEGFSLCSPALSPGLGTCRPPSTPSSPGTPTLASGPPCLRVLGSSPPSPGDLTHGRYRLRAPSVCRSCGAVWLRGASPPRNPSGIPSATPWKHHGHGDGRLARSVLGVS